jgi:short-subunit dehydrogenase
MTSPTGWLGPRRRQLDGLRAVVTGGSSGLGQAIARLLASQGVAVLATARRSDRLEQLRSGSSKDSGSIRTLAGDLTDEAFRDQLLRHAHDDLGGLDLLVLAAGSGAVGRFEEASPETLRRVMEIDFFAPLELTRRSLPLLRSGRDPAVVLVGSIIGRHPLPLHLEYAAAKAALTAAAGSLRMELAPCGVDVVLATLGPLASEFWGSLLAGSRAAWSRGRAMPAEIAAAKIVRSLVQRRGEVTPGWQAKAYVTAARLVPGLLDRCIAARADL